KATSVLELQLEAEGARLPLPNDPVDARLRPIVAKLVHPSPAERYRDARDVIADLGDATGVKLPVETVATRESFLRSVPLVGRESELRALEGALAETKCGRGATWLVAGESGVGKSRLLDELRTRALVDGVVVVRGQAVDQGGSPYHVWR